MPTGKTSSLHSVYSQTCNPQSTVLLGHLSVWLPFPAVGHTSCSWLCKGSCPALCLPASYLWSPASLHWHPCITNTSKCNHLVQDFITSRATSIILFCMWLQLAGARGFAGAWRTAALPEFASGFEIYQHLGNACDYLELFACKNPPGVYSSNDCSSDRAAIAAIQLQLETTFPCLKHGTFEQPLTKKKCKMWNSVCTFVSILELIISF